MSSPPPPSPDPVRAYFDAAAREYGARTGGGVWRWVRAREADAVVRACGDVAGKRVLDAGCGAGFYSGVMRAAGAAEVVGIDYSAAMIDAYRAAGFDGRLADLDAFDLGRTLDLVLCAGALEFVTHPDAVMRRLAAHLAPGGRVVVLVPRAGVLGGFYRRYHRGHGLGVRLFTPASLRTLATSANLRELAPLRRPLFSLVGAFGTAAPLR